MPAVCNLGPFEGKSSNSWAWRGAAVGAVEAGGPSASANCGATGDAMLGDFDECERFDEDDILDADEWDDLFLVEVELE